MIPSLLKNLQSIYLFKSNLPNINCVPKLGVTIVVNDPFHFFDTLRIEHICHSYVITFSLDTDRPLEISILEAHVGELELFDAQASGVFRETFGVAVYFLTLSVIWAWKKEAVWPLIVVGEEEFLGESKYEHAEGWNCRAKFEINVDWSLLVDFSIWNLGNL